MFMPTVVTLTHIRKSQTWELIYLPLPSLPSKTLNHANCVSTKGGRLICLFLRPQQGGWQGILWVLRPLSLMWARFSMPGLGLDWTEADRVPSLTKKMIFCLAGNKRDSDRPILSSGAKKLISPTGTPTWLVETSRCLSFFGIQAELMGHYCSYLLPLCPVKMEELQVNGRFYPSRLVTL